MKLALIQQSASPDRDQNVSQGLENVRLAAESGAELIGFAELAFDRFYPQQPATSQALEQAVSIPGPLIDPFCELAVKYDCVIVLNVFERFANQTFDRKYSNRFCNQNMNSINSRNQILHAAPTPGGPRA